MKGMPKFRKDKQDGTRTKKAKQASEQRKTVKKYSFKFSAPQP